MREGIREPIFNIPRVVMLLLAAMTVIQAVRMALSPETDLQWSRFTASRRRDSAFCSIRAPSSII